MTDISQLNNNEVVSSHHSVVFKITALPSLDFCSIGFAFLSFHKQQNALHRGRGYAKHDEV